VDDKTTTAAGYVQVKGIMAAKGQARAIQREKQKEAQQKAMESAGLS